MTLDHLSDRDLEVLVSIKVMGYTEEKANFSHLFPTSIKYAWEVVDAMEKKGFVLSLDAPHALVNDEMSAYAKRWEATFAWWRTQEDEPHQWPETYHGMGVADTAPRAICVAALSAMGYKHA